GTLAMAKDRLQLKGIQLVENYTPNITTIGDAGKLQTALLNIIINAVEAMEENKGRLQIETLSNADTLVIKISDNGCGISPENISLLFQPYFTGKKNGVGLGLATTHNYIHAHNGSIEVESVAGSGSTFTVKLPMV
ncbi:MAG TPA: ATP-binding protein, partial [Chitinophagales bacterium]|nr:ATP-binding protein [Chitinophagales bacterium]